MLASDIATSQTADVLGRVGRAIVAAEHEARPVGAWGLLRALHGPKVQRAAGFLLAMARCFGEELAASPRLLSEGTSGASNITRFWSSAEGPGGITVAALLRAQGISGIAIVEPSESHLATSRCGSLVEAQASCRRRPATEPSRRTTSRTA